MTYFGVRVREDGLHQVYRTDDGITRSDVPNAAWPKPRPAIAYCDMRQLNVRPVRLSEEDVVEPPDTASSSERLTTLPPA